MLRAQGVAQPSAPAENKLTEKTLRSYLSRAITLQGAVEMPATGRMVLLPWAGRLGTRFAGRVGGFWLTPESDAREQAWYDSTRRAVALLRNVQPTVVVQGAIYEIVYATVDSITVPNAVRAEFGEDTMQPRHRHFQLTRMMYPAYFAHGDSVRYRWDNRPAGQAPGTPDMSRSETQMWFYFCARRQLDAGCEAIHFGQVQLMDDRDPGHAAWWSMLSRVRRYASTRNRGFVLCDAHTHGEYYDPDPTHPAPDSVRQLLFDFHSYPARPFEVDTLRRGQHGARIDYANRVQPSSAIYKVSGGGRTPSGWFCHHLPALVEMDNWGPAVLGKPDQWPWLWGLDEASWFATQPRTYRTQWLVYAPARVQQLDADTYFEFPGLRVVCVPGQPARDYRADLDNQGSTISSVWQGQATAAAQALILTGPPTEEQVRALQELTR